MRVPLVDLTAQFQPIKGEVMRAIEEVLDSMQLFLGPNTRAFEEEFAAYCGTRSCVTVGNGTDARSSLSRTPSLPRPRRS